MTAATPVTDEMVDRALDAAPLAATSTSWPKIVWWDGAVGPPERLAETLEGYAKIRPGAGRDQWAMKAAAKFIRQIISATDLPSSTSIEPRTWRCFHCDEVFDDIDAARHHFGDSELQEPICKVTAERYREVERQLAEYQQEADACSRTFYTLGAEHYRKERDAEQKGYDRGLADAKAYPGTLGLATFAQIDTIRAEARRLALEDAARIADAYAERMTATAMKREAEGKPYDDAAFMRLAGISIAFAIREAMGRTHVDDRAVDNFAVVMKTKLAKKRAEGRGGWQDKQDCSNAVLSRLLREHVEKGDPVDVANFAMMIHQRDERIG